MKIKLPALTLAAALSFPLFVSHLNAATLQAMVSVEGKGGLANAVVYAVPKTGVPMGQMAAGKHSINQVDKEFVPSVSVIQTGSNVEFPNQDNIRHHVYSFSDAKTFEIPLYKGKPAEPITFDQPGVINLGCNIHDWMSAHVLVTDTPFFGTSDAEGKVVLSNLPEGGYDVYVWHPQQSTDSTNTSRQIELDDNEELTLGFTVQKKKQWVPFRAPTRAAGSYR